MIYFAKQGIIYGIHSNSKSNDYPKTKIRYREGEFNNGKNVL